tara:strand:+ start:1726 stop:3570 length:1845 start_codon:yes stop_codon:yes gene_type:complete
VNYILNNNEKNLIVNSLLDYGLDKEELINFFTLKPKQNSIDIKTKFNLDAKINLIGLDHQFDLSKYKKINLNFLIFRIKDHDVNNLIKRLEKENYYMITQRTGIAIFTNHTYQKVNDIVSSRKITNKRDFLKKYPELNGKYVRKIDESASVEDSSILPHLLVNTKRFDILIKLHYARLKKKNVAKTWRDFTYSKHVRHITGPSEKVVEYDGTGKEGESKFFEVFDKLINSKIKDFLPVLTDKNYVLMDGSHRASVAIINNDLIKTGNFDVQAKNNANYSFFLNRNGKNPGLPEIILDEAAIDAIRFKKGLRIVLLFPSVISKKFAIDYLKSNCEIIYNKTMIINRAGGREILKETYLGHSIIHYGSDLLEQKIENCFISKGPLTVLLIQNFDLKSINQVKDDIRKHYSIGHDSIHITDSDDELSRVSKILFNNNSIDLINAQIDLDKNTQNLILNFRNWIELNNLNSEDFVIGGSALLGLMGCRKINDIDFHYAKNYTKLPKYPENIQDHSSQIKYYLNNVDDLIYDPRNYFWYMGLKFCSPKIIYKMKLNRGEFKDLIDAKDIQLIIRKTSKSKVNFQYSLNFTLLMKIFYRKFRNSIANSRVYRKIKKILNY